LDKTYEECPGRDVKIIIGDLNAKTDKEDSYRPTIGKYSVHTKSNDSGIRLINFASSRNMVTGSTMFDHKDIHKMTWKSPERNISINHLIIDTRHLTNLMDVMTYRGLNVVSDHYLVISNVRS
jgi:endonuclease/exonuclease/phosphatase family metal-dependent hydrolase